MRATKYFLSQTLALLFGLNACQLPMASDSFPMASVQSAIRPGSKGERIRPGSKGDRILEAHQAAVEGVLHIPFEVAAFVPGKGFQVKQSAANDIAFITEFLQTTLDGQPALVEFCSFERLQTKNEYVIAYRLVTTTLLPNQILEFTVPSQHFRLSRLLPALVAGQTLPTRQRVDFKSTALVLLLQTMERKGGKRIKSLSVSEIQQWKQSPEVAAIQAVLYQSVKDNKKQDWLDDTTITENMEQISAKLLVGQVIPSSQVNPSTQVNPSSQVSPSTQVNPSTQVSPSTQVNPSSQVSPSTQVIPSSQVNPSTQVSPSPQVSPSSQVNGNTPTPPSPAPTPQPTEEPPPRSTPTDSGNENGNGNGHNNGNGK